MHLLSLLWTVADPGLSAERQTVISLCNIRRFAKGAFLIVALLLMGCRPGTQPTYPHSPQIDTKIPIASSETSQAEKSDTPKAIPEVPTFQTVTPISTVYLEPTRTLMKPTVFVTQSSSQSESEMLQIFASTPGFLYATLDPIKGISQIIDPSYLGIQPDKVGASDNLAFANNSNRVAIWYREPGIPGVLWLTDMALNEASRAFVDESELFSTDRDFPPQDVNLEWFPNDRYVLLRPTKEELEPLLLDAETLSVQEWGRACNSVIKSTKTSALALLCTGSEDTLVMEWSGDLWPLEADSGYQTLWKDSNQELNTAAWNPSGNKIAYVTESEPTLLYVLDSQRQVLSIPFDVNTLLEDTIRWTDSGAVLIGATLEDATTDWFLVDDTSGEVQWSLSTTQGFNWSREVQQTMRLLRAEIDPTGTYIVFASQRTDLPSGNQLLMANVPENEFLGIVADVGFGLSAFAWKK